MKIAKSGAKVASIVVGVSVSVKDSTLSSAEVVLFDCAVFRVSDGAPILAL